MQARRPTGERERAQHIRFADRLRMVRACGERDSFAALARLSGMAFEHVDYTSLDIPAAPFSDPAIVPDFPKNKVPRHVGVIMGGNGRWGWRRTRRRFPRARRN